MKKAGVPVMIVQGGADTVVPATNTRAWIASLESLEMDHKYIEFPDRDAPCTWRRATAGTSVGS
jgi:dipeptidyl aminopeptidase/acylaminoacyl peptidase